MLVPFSSQEAIPAHCRWMADSPTAGLAPLRVGFAFALANQPVETGPGGGAEARDAEAGAFSRLQWFGRGPHEAYADRRAGAAVGLFPCHHRYLRKITSRVQCARNLTERAGNSWVKPCMRNLSNDSLFVLHNHVVAVLCLSYEQVSLYDGTVAAHTFRYVRPQETGSKAEVTFFFRHHHHHHHHLFFVFYIYAWRCGM